MHARCPQCSHTLEINEADELTNVECPSCGSRVTLFDDDNTHTFRGDLPSAVGQFSLMERIGAGAFGTVWKAKDSKLDRWVAIKVPRNGQLSDAEREKFLREARAAAQLKHPNIIHIHEVHQTDSSIYLVSDFIDGVTLDEWKASRQTNVRECVEICERIAIALQHAHDHEVIHRDLKPSNIMVDAGGEPVLMDFGLAKREAGEITMTVEGQVLGTPAYMPPEQARGDSHDADARSDVYALGVILFELVTGERPYRGNQRMLIYQIINDEPPSPRRFSAQIPRDIETICLKCLEKDPSRRYQTAAKLGEDLRRFLDGKPILARPVGRLARAQRWCRRNPLVASLSGAISLLLIALAVGSLVSAWMLADYNQRMGRQRIVDEVDYARNIDFAFRAFEYTRMSLVSELLHEVNFTASDGTDLRGIEWHLICDVTQRELLTLRGHEAPVRCVCYSTDGSLIFSGDSSGVLRVWSREEARCLETIDAHVNGISEIATSPDGNYLLTGGSDGRIIVWRLSNWSKKQTFDRHLLEISAILFSDASPGEVISASTDGSLYRWTIGASADDDLEPLLLQEFPIRNAALNHDASRLAVIIQNPEIQAIAWSVHFFELTDELTPIAVFPNVGARDLDFAADGMVAGVGYGAPVQLWNPEPRMIRPITGLVADLNACAFADNGSIVVAAGYDGSIAIIDVPMRKWRDTYKGHRSQVNCLAIRDKEEEFASGGADGEIKIWSLRPRDSLAGHVTRVSAIAFGPDGRFLASSSHDQSVKYWDTHAGREHLALPEVTFGYTEHGDLQYVDATGGHTNPVMDVAVSHRGDLIASASLDNTVRVWDVESANTRLAIPHRGPVVAVTFSHDDSMIATVCWDDAVRIWNAEDGSLIHELTGHEGHPSCALFLPDDRELISGGDDGTLRIWSVESGEQIRKIDAHHRGVKCMALRPDDQRLATGGADQIVRVWDATTLELELELLGHTHGVAGVAFHPSENRLASASADSDAGMVRLWNLDVGVEVAQMHGYQDVCFSPDGWKLAFVTKSNSISILDGKRGSELGIPPRPPSKRSSADANRSMELAADGDMRTMGFAALESLVVFDGSNNVQLDADEDKVFLMVMCSVPRAVLVPNPQEYAEMLETNNHLADRSRISLIIPGRFSLIVGDEAIPARLIRQWHVAGELTYGTVMRRSEELPLGERLMLAVVWEVDREILESMPRLRVSDYEPTAIRNRSIAHLLE